jgi:Uncharacterised protein family (UPF0158)
MPRTLLLSELIAALKLGEAVPLDDVEPTADPSAARVSDGVLCLPVFTEQDEVELARQFVATVEGEDRGRLSLALASDNAREAFESALFRCRIAHEWFQFREQHLRQVAKDALEKQGIPYVDDVTGQTN